MSRGDLIIIGGNEAKEGDGAAILDEVARIAARRQGRLVVLTVATLLPEELAAEYRRVFERLGVRDVDVLDVRTREDAYDPARVARLDGAAILFFTGGDQLRITSRLGGTPVLEHIFALHREGAAIVGTSAGAAAMSETMLIAGPGNDSSVSGLAMAPGLGLLSGAIVDSHFAQRGRFVRLLGAVAQNPHNLGIGIDEDTAIRVEDEETFTVLGGGGVYVFDAARITYTSISDQRVEGVLSIHDAKVSVLGRGDRYHLRDRACIPAPEPRQA